MKVTLRCTITDIPLNYVVQGFSDCAAKPDLLKPDITKMGLERLPADLPKYKPWLSPSAWLDWEEFMSTTGCLTEVMDIPWEMHVQPCKYSYCFQIIKSYEGTSAQ